MAEDDAFGPSDQRRIPRGVRRRVAERRLQLLQLRPQVLPRGLPGDAGHAGRAHTPTAFHANVVAMDKGHLTIEDVAEDYVHCTMCGACELRCPNTLFTGDFYRFRQRTVDVVKAMRALAVEQGVHQENWKRWAELTDRWGTSPCSAGTSRPSRSKVRAWAAGLDIPAGGETVLFADCEAAFYRPSVPRRSRSSSRPRASSSGS